VTVQNDLASPPISDILLRYLRRYNDALVTSSPWRLPADPLRASVVRATGVGMLATVALALLVASVTGLGGSYLVICLAVFMLAATMVTGLVSVHHPFERFGPANLITLLRVSFLAAMTGLVGEPPTTRIAWLAVGATTLVAVLDGLDGWLARRSRVSSAFGARFDMETDAALILVVSVLVWRHDKAAAWVMACGAMRYAFVVAGWLLPWMAAPLRSTVRGKTVAILQLVGLGVALLPVVPVPASVIVSTITLAALVWSFAVDVAWLWKGRLTSTN